MKQFIGTYTQEFFPNRSWHDISCEDFFAPFHLPLKATAWRPAVNTTAACTALTQGEYNVSYEPFVATFATQWAAFNGGTPVCTVEQPVVSRGNYLEYVGDCAWQPLQWQHMVDAMLQWFWPSEKRYGITQWNEIIASLPATLAEEAAVARAVFYVKEPGMNTTTLALLRAAAQANGDMWGGKPILETDLARYQVGGQLFTCAEDELVEERQRKPMRSDAKEARGPSADYTALVEEAKATRPGGAPSFSHV